MSDVRLGDIIEDYCSRCRLLTDHSVAAMVDGTVKKVRCRTCQSDHDYRHGKRTARRAKLTAYEQVLATLSGPGGGIAAEQKARRGRP